MQDVRLSAQQKQPVFITPARTREVAGKPLSFVFAMRQVEDIIGEVELRPVPFSPHFLKGVAQWRGRVIPVIGLESCLGLDAAHETASNRYLVVRSAERTAESGEELKSILWVDPAIRMAHLPQGCVPINPAAWLQNTNLVRGVYAYEKGFLAVVHLENILKGSTPKGSHQAEMKDAVNGRTIRGPGR